jgi:preprotein translocase subunit SecG
MLTTLLYIVFVLAAIVLIVVILLQEGRGGGFGEALGGHGQATFGVGAQGINRFTGWVAAVFLVTAVAITIVHRGETGSVLGTGPGDPGIEAPPDPASASPPAPEGGQ